MSTPQTPEPSQSAPTTRRSVDDESLADGEWHRLHPLTPLFKGGLVLIIVAGVALNNFRDRIVFWFISLFTPKEAHVEDYAGNDPLDWVLANNLILVVLLVVLGVLVVLCALFWMVWRFQQFRISDEHVEVRKGIIFRSHRRAPLDRVQGVNLTRPFPARLIGMAKLEVVGAGTDANVALEYLSTPKAEGVRSDILRLASGARAARQARQGGPQPTPPTTMRGQLVGSMNDGVNDLIGGVDLSDVTPESVVKIPTGRLVGSQLLSGVLWFVFFLAIFAVVLAFTVPAILSDGDPDAWLGVVAVVLGVGVPFIIATVAITWGQISKSLRYSIAPTPDGVRITFGLFTTITETIPPGRIFAVEVTQSLLWRPFGWWAIKINRMSGKSAAQQQSSTAQQFNIVLPVGTRGDVERVLGLVLPGLPEQDVPLVWEHGILGPQEDDPYEVLQRRAWWRRPLSWKRHGFAVTDFGLILRRGVFWRKLAVFPLARLQGVSAEQGPIDRAQRVAALKAHSVTGPVLGEVVGIESVALTAALDDVVRRAAAAANRDPGHRWAEEPSYTAAPEFSAPPEPAAPQFAAPSFSAPPPFSAPAPPPPPVPPVANDDLPPEMPNGS